MNLRRKKPHDSLYMLLDTMCDAFGGIILLAVLVTLLTSRERQGKSEGASDTQEMLQRRLVLARTSLQQSVELFASLQARTKDDRWKNQLAQLAVRKALQDTLKEARDAVVRNFKELDTADAKDQAERLKFLNSELAAAQRRKIEIQNRLAAAEENSKRLKQRKNDLEKQVATKLGESQQPLRLPLERNSGKDVFNVIVQYGRMYPLRSADHERNRTSITWQETLTGVTPSPIPGKGLDPRYDTAALRQLFEALPRSSCYVAFYVFEDSFPAFNAAKRIAVSSGLDYGWMPLELKEAPISFGAVGTRPKPQ